MKSLHIFCVHTDGQTWSNHIAAYFLRTSRAASANQTTSYILRTHSRTDHSIKSLQKFREHTQTSRRPIKALHIFREHTLSLWRCITVVDDHGGHIGSSVDVVHGWWGPANYLGGIVALMNSCHSGRWSVAQKWIQTEEQLSNKHRCLFLFRDFISYLSLLLFALWRACVSNRDRRECLRWTLAHH